MELDQLLADLGWHFVERVKNIFFHMCKQKEVVRSGIGLWKHAACDDWWMTQVDGLATASGCVSFGYFFFGSAASCLKKKAL